MEDLDDDWQKFLDNEEFGIETANNCLFDESKRENIPKCSKLYISTKTIIAFLNKEDIDIKNIFWKIPIISYSDNSNGIIKKQIKFSTTSKDEVEEIEQKTLSAGYSDVQIIEHIDNPNGRIKYKDQRKISIGMCKKDLISYRSKKKRAFFNCFVLIFRIYDSEDDCFKEMHVKIFNTGKMEIPGVQSDRVLDNIINLLLDILRPYLGDDLMYNSEKNETVLINSNFNCGYYIDRDKFYNTLKYKYRINSNFDSCSYPGIQSKFYYIHDKEEQTGCQPSKGEPCTEISFMIFRTGSILIVGKCNETILQSVYQKLKTIMEEEFYDINVGLVNVSNLKPVSNVKKLRKKTIIVS